MQRSPGSPWQRQRRGGASVSFARPCCAFEHSLHARIDNLLSGWVPADLRELHRASIDLIACCFGPTDCESLVVFHVGLPAIYHDYVRSCFSCNMLLQTWFASSMFRFFYPRCFEGTLVLPYDLLCLDSLWEIYGLPITALFIYLFICALKQLVKNCGHDVSKIENHWQ